VLVVLVVLVLVVLVLVVLVLVLLMRAPPTKRQCLLFLPRLSWAQHKVI
jgi:hypothetical protein